MMKKSETDRIIQREVGRLPRTAGTSFRLTRRALLKSVAALAAAWTISPWRIVVPSAFGQGMEDPATIATLEAYADTLIPGEKRFPGDRAIAGVVSGAGAVQGGALDMMNFVGFEPLLFFVGVAINAYAVLYALLNGITLDPTVPPFVSLDFASRTALVVAMLGGSGSDQPVFTALAALSFVAFNTAGYLSTVDAIREGHPGLAAIGFPPPNPDGKWRFPEFSYQRLLAEAHPRSKRDNPA